MLSTTFRPVSRLSSSLYVCSRTAFRRHLADQPSAAVGRGIISPEDAQSIPTQRMTHQGTPPPRGGRSGAFYLMLMGGALLTVPPVSYFYWEHRKAHMKAKKEAMLKDIRARYS